jgi:hypothetical protein
MKMTKAKLKKIIEQELIKEFGNIGGRASNLGAIRDKDEDDVPDYTKLKKYEEILDSDASTEDYIKDFKKSDAPQFKGKSKKKKIEMAIAAAASAKKKRG